MNGKYPKNQSLENYNKFLMLKQLYQYVFYIVIIAAIGITLLAYLYYKTPIDHRKILDFPYFFSQYVPSFTLSVVNFVYTSIGILVTFLIGVIGYLQSHTKYKTPAYLFTLMFIPLYFTDSRYFIMLLGIPIIAMSILMKPKSGFIVGFLFTLLDIVSITFENIRKDPQERNVLLGILGLILPFFLLYMLCALIAFLISTELHRGFLLYNSQHAELLKAKVELSQKVESQSHEIKKDITQINSIYKEKSQLQQKIQDMKNTITRLKNN